MERSDNRMKASPDAVISEMASRQCGLVGRAQLIAAGVTCPTIHSRVRSRRLEPIQRGVYRVGPLVHARSKEMAAILACRGAAVVSHWSAGAIWDLCDRRDGEVDVSVLSIDRGRRPGIRVHRPQSLPRDEVVEHDGIPVTVPARTILDIAGHVGVRDAEKMLARAERLELTSMNELRKIVSRYPGRRGTRCLCALMDADETPAFTRSEAEDRFLTLVRRARLPPPAANVKVGGLEVDFYWRSQALVVEIDGFAFHSSKAQFRNDRGRDAVLGAMGLRVMRFTWDNLTNEHEVVLARVAQALAFAVAGKG